MEPIRLSPSVKRFIVCLIGIWGPGWACGGRTNKTESSDASLDVGTDTPLIDASLHDSVTEDTSLADARTVNDGQVLDGDAKMADGEPVDAKTDGACATFMYQNEDASFGQCRAARGAYVCGRDANPTAICLGNEPAACGADCVDQCEPTEYAYECGGPPAPDAGAGLPQPPPDAGVCRFLFGDPGLQLFYCCSCGA